MKRIISLLLVLCFMLTALIACGGGNKDTESPSESGSGSDSGAATENNVTLTVTNPYGDPELIKTIEPDEHDYNGEQIVMLIRDDEKIKREFGIESSTEEINEQILTRNAQVAADLNMEMIPEYIGSSDAGNCREVYAQRIAADVGGKMHTADIAAHFAYYACDTSVREYSANLLDEYTFPYFDFSLPCWNQAIVDESNINGKSIVCAGDMTLSLFNFAMILWHNKSLYADNRNKIKGSPEDIQDTVLSGDWTADKLYNWAQFYENTSASDECDTYGVYLGGKNWCTNIDTLPHAWNLDLMEEKADGTHAYTVIGNTKAEEAVVLYRDMWNSQGNAYMHSANSDGGGRGVCNTEGGCFIAGNIVFQTSTISWDAASSEALRGMEDIYSIIPYPKWDELQVGTERTEFQKLMNIEDMGYYTTAQDCYSLIGVLDHFESDVPTKGDIVSAYLQHSSELSYADVRGYYFDVVIRGKNLGVDDSDGTVSKSIRIFNMIINNLQFDYWALYSASLGDVMHLFRYTVTSDSDTLEQRYKSKQETYEKALRDCDVLFGLITE